MFDGIIYLRDILSTDASDATTISETILAHPDVQEALEIVLDSKKFKVVQTQKVTLEKNKDFRGYETTPKFKSLSEQNGVDFIYPDTEQEARVVVFLKDMKEQSGAYLYIPNSHKARCWPTADIMRSGQFEDTDKLLYPCKRKVLETQKGSVAVFPGSLWHSKGLNKTDENTVYFVIDVQSDEN